MIKLLVRRGFSLLLEYNKKHQCLVKGKVLCLLFLFRKGKDKEKVKILAGICYHTFFKLVPVQLM